MKTELTPGQESWILFLGDINRGITGGEVESWATLLMDATVEQMTRLGVDVPSGYNIMA